MEFIRKITETSEYKADSERIKSINIIKWRYILSINSTSGKPMLRVGLGAQVCGE